MWTLTTESSRLKRLYVIIIVIGTLNVLGERRFGSALGRAQIVIRRR